MTELNLMRARRNADFLNSVKKKVSSTLDYNEHWGCKRAINRATWAFEQ